jgi:HSP20 family protein
MANIIRRNTGEQSPVLREWSPFRMMDDLLNWDPFRTMAPMLSGRESATGGFGFIPSFEVKETKDGYVFKADLPGVKEGDLDISLSSNTLTVSGKRESEEREEGETWYAYERSYGSFTRSFTLPEGANADAASADLREGVLTLTVPKRPEAQPKKIAVKAKSALEGAVEKVKGALGKDKGEPAKA